MWKALFAEIYLGWTVADCNDEWWSVELATQVREDFTNTENTEIVPTRRFAYLRFLKCPNFTSTYIQHSVLSVKAKKALVRDIFMIV